MSVKKIAMIGIPIIIGVIVVIIILVRNSKGKNPSSLNQPLIATGGDGVIHTDSPEYNAQMRDCISEYPQEHSGVPPHFQELQPHHVEQPQQLQAQQMHPPPHQMQQPQQMPPHPDQMHQQPQQMPPHPEQMQQPPPDQQEQQPPKKRVSFSQLAQEIESGGSSSQQPKHIQPYIGKNQYNAAYHDQMGQMKKLSTGLEDAHPNQQFEKENKPYNQGTSQYSYGYPQEE